VSDEGPDIGPWPDSPTLPPEPEEEILEDEPYPEDPFQTPPDPWEPPQWPPPIPVGTGGGWPVPPEPADGGWGFPRPTGLGPFDPVRRRRQAAAEILVDRMLDDIMWLWLSYKTSTDTPPPGQRTSPAALMRRESAKRKGQAIERGGRHLRNALLRVVRNKMKEPTGSWPALKKVAETCGRCGLTLPQFLTKMKPSSGSLAAEINYRQAEREIREAGG